MKNWLKVLSVVVIGLGAIHFQTTTANGNSSIPGKEAEVRNVTIAWIDKPPYLTLPDNGSLDNEAHGMMRDVLLKYMIECGYRANVEYRFKTLRVDSEFEMIELLKKNKVHSAAPIFEPKDIRRYSQFPFFKLNDYPGTDFIITEDKTKGLSVVFDALLKSWPLLAVTLVLTAIAGVIVWALKSDKCELSSPGMETKLPSRSQLVFSPSSGSLLVALSWQSLMGMSPLH
ncbi:hypothetical protein OS493_026149 [Desmophyllum pertusum]|uniref:Solute-binding protein family 3/N-terminal domain-containing protein n=1 Tax=Desmophyllum pertusum TaxID=174260 RepID=A0A9W9ZZW4_9CNID|nr:hypothetical protein OS493_026149 [Desmophyllum pertusum]